MADTIATNGPAAAHGPVTGGLHPGSARGAAAQRVSRIPTGQAMSTITLDEWEIASQEGGPTLRVVVEQDGSMGAACKPGLRIRFQGRSIGFDRQTVDEWAQAAAREGTLLYRLEEHCWQPEGGCYVRCYLIVGRQPIARVEVLAAGARRPVSRDYPLPFQLAAG